jgi:hypothetical protein
MTKGIPVTLVTSSVSDIRSFLDVVKNSKVPEAFILTTDESYSRYGNNNCKMFPILNGKIFRLQCSIEYRNLHPYLLRPAILGSVSTLGKMNVSDLVTHLRKTMCTYYITWDVET